MGVFSFLMPALLVASPAPTCAVHGVVENLDPKATTVVALERDVRSPRFAPSEPVTHSIYQRNETFVPAVLVISRGDWVVFKNDDFEFHSVFSATQKLTFDMPPTNRGETGQQRFQAAGVARIQCNRHKKMRADVIVVDSPVRTVVGAGGEFTLEAPAGPWLLTTYDSNGTRVQQKVQACVPGARDVRVQLPGATATERQRDKAGDDRGFVYAN